MPDTTKLSFDVHVYGVRQDVTPRVESIACEIVVDSDEPTSQMAMTAHLVMPRGNPHATAHPRFHPH